MSTNATGSLLIDLFSEEIPARMQKTAAQDFARLLNEALKDEGLATGTAQVWYAPRHLAVRIDGIPTAQADRTEERRGGAFVPHQSSGGAFTPESARGRIAQDCAPRATRGVAAGARPAQLDGTNTASRFLRRSSAFT